MKHLLLTLLCLLALSASAQSVRVDITNGERNICGELIRPMSWGNKKAPLLIVAHGFNGSRRFGRAYAEPLRSDGVMVYTFDFPCGGLMSESNPNTMDMSVLDEVSDLKAIVNYFRSQPYVDRRRIIVLGESQGGLVASLVAAEMQKQIAALVLVYPALSIPDNWRHAYPDITNIPDTTRLWNVPLGRRYFAEVHDMHPYDIITAYKRPVLVIHGDHDRVIPVSYGERAAKEYKDARLHIISGADHGFRPQEFNESVGEILKFLHERVLK